MKRDMTRTRKISPWLGLLGLLGFISPILYIELGNPNALLFLGFFGFFGFYFEGKMSNTLRDESFQYNEQRAVATASKITSVSMAFILIITVNWVSQRGIEIAYTFLVAALALLWALQISLPLGLLYYYENKE